MAILLVQVSNDIISHLRYYQGLKLKIKPCFFVSKKKGERKMEDELQTTFNSDDLNKLLEEGEAENVSNQNNVLN